MQSNVARRIETVERQKIPITLARVSPPIPSTGEQERVWVKKTLTQETIAEVVLITATFFLVGSLFFSLYRALQNYIIIGLP
jgi:hypothetical protein